VSQSIQIYKSSEPCLKCTTLVKEDKQEK